MNYIILNVGIQPVFVYYIVQNCDNQTWEDFLRLSGSYILFAMTDTSMIILIIQINKTILNTLNNCIIQPVKVDNYKNDTFENIKIIWTNVELYFLLEQ